MAKHAKVQQDEKIITPEVETVLIAPDPIAGTAGVSVITPQNDGVPTQVANPSRASWRSFAQGLVSFLLVVNVALPLVYLYISSDENTQLLSALLGDYYVPILAGLNIAVGIGSFITKGIALLMANPTVNDWIKKHLSFLSPIPVKPIDGDANGDGTTPNLTTL